MSVATKQYHLKSREHLMDAFRTVPNIASDNLEDIEANAREYAIKHPGNLVQIHSDTDGFEVQYRYRDDQMYISHGHGWHLYE